MATLTALVGGGNWTAGTTWDTGNTPTAADDCLLISTSGNVTIDTGAVCRSMNLTGYTHILTHTAGVTMNIGDATAGLGDVALEWPTSGWTYTLGSASTSFLIFVSTASSVQSVNFGGKTTGPITFNAASNGSWQYTGPQVTASATATLLLTKGTLDTNNQTLTLASTIRSNSASNVRALTLGTSAITCQAWDMGAGSFLALSAASSTITLRVGATTFNGGGKTYGTVTVTSGAGTLAIAGANTFTNFAVAGGTAKTLQFTAATTTTFLNPPTLVGTSGNVITIASVTAATHTLSLATGTVQADWLSLTNSIATGGALWEAGVHSLDGGGNTGWIFNTILVTPARQWWSASTALLTRSVTLPPAQTAWQVGTLALTRTALLVPAQWSWQASVLEATRRLDLTAAQLAWLAVAVEGLPTHTRALAPFVLEVTQGAEVFVMAVRQVGDAWVVEVP